MKNFPPYFEELFTCFPTEYEYCEMLQIFQVSLKEWKNPLNSYKKTREIVPSFTNNQRNFLPSYLFNDFRIKAGTSRSSASRLDPGSGAFSGKFLEIGTTKTTNTHSFCLLIFLIRTALKASSNNRYFYFTSKGFIDDRTKIIFASGSAASVMIIRAASSTSNIEIMSSGNVEENALRSINRVQEAENQLPRAASAARFSPLP